MVGERHAHRITPCGPASSEIDLICSCVGHTGNAMRSVESFPISDPFQNSGDRVCGCCRAEDCDRCLR